METGSITPLQAAVAQALILLGNPITVVIIAVLLILAIIAQKRKEQKKNTPS